MKALADERRLVSRVLRHWRERARQGRPYPNALEIDPWLVGDDWESCFLVKRDQGEEYTFLAVGSALSSKGASLELSPVSKCPPDTVLAATLKHLSRCVAGETISIESTASHNGTPVLFRAVLAPVAEDGMHPDGAFGAVNYRAMVPGDDKSLRTRNEVRELEVRVGQLWEVFDAALGWQRMAVLSIEGEQVKLMNKQNFLRRMYPITDMTTHSEKFRFVGPGGAHS
jgi:hypothetical protein